MYEPNPEESLIKDYLLGRLGGEPERLFGERFLADPEFRALALMVEEELIESYVFGLLSGAEREQFVSRFMSNPRQADKVKLFSLVNSYAGAAAEAHAEGAPKHGRDEGEAAHGSWLARLVAPFRARRLRLVLPLAAALLIVAVTGALLLTQVRRAGRERDAVLARRAAVEREVSRLNVGPEAGQLTPPNELFAVTLSPTLVRGSGEMPRVVAPPGARVVQLRLALLWDDESYSAALLTDSGEELFTLHGLTARAGDGGGVLNLNLPAGLLTAGDYQVRLRGAGGGGRQAREAFYTFRVPAR